MASERLAMLAFAVATAALLCAANAQPTTFDTRFDGFTYVSNVIGYVNMTVDYCDMKAAIAAGNFTRALDIYATGKNSFSGLARRTFYRFASFVPAAGVSEPLHDALAMGRNGTWLDAMIRDAAANRDATLFLGLIQVAALKYFFHELDEGFTKISNYLQDRTNNAVLISDATGAPHNIDEAFALWAGGNPKACATLSSWAAELGRDLETSYVGRTYLNSAMTLAINELLATSRKADRVPYNTTRFLVQRYVTLMGLQGVMRWSFRAEAAAACKRPPADVTEAKAMVAVHWTYLQPLLVARRVRAPLMDKLAEALLGDPHPSYSQALPAFKSVISAIDRRMSEVGAPRFDRITAGWGCRASVMPPLSRRMLLGSSTL